MSLEPKLKQIVEAALLAAGGPLTLDNLQELFLEQEMPEKPVLRDALNSLRDDYEERGIELVEVGGGFRVNTRVEFAPWVSRLWQERPVKYTRALLETLALIAYRQPITRGEIEEIRGVSVSSSIVKTLIEREWVRVVGKRDVPGRPSLYATTREFLNYFSLNGLDNLPTLQEIRDLDSINRELELSLPGSEPAPHSEIAESPVLSEDVVVGQDVAETGKADASETDRVENSQVSEEDGKAPAGTDEDDVVKDLSQE